MHKTHTYVPTCQHPVPTYSVLWKGCEVSRLQRIETAIHMEICTARRPGRELDLAYTHLHKHQFVSCFPVSPNSGEYKFISIRHVCNLVYSGTSEAQSGGRVPSKRSVPAHRPELERGQTWSDDRQALYDGCMLYNPFDFNRGGREFFIAHDSTPGPMADTFSAADRLTDGVFRQIADLAKQEDVVGRIQYQVMPRR